MNWVYPVKGKFKYGPKFGVVDSWHPNGHRGTDYNGFPSGRDLVAVADGEIALIKTSAILGNVVVLKVKATWKGKPETVFFGYCHMVKPCALKVGTKVKAGETIGFAGTSGSASSGVHLHFTLSLSVNGVFAGAVYDGDAYVGRRIKEQKALATVATVTPAVTASTDSTRCETCPCKNGCKN